MFVQILTCFTNAELLQIIYGAMACGLMIGAGVMQWLNRNQ